MGNYKKLFLYFFLNTTSIINIQVFAQQGLFVLPGFEIGTLNHYKFQQHGNVLQKGFSDKNIAEAAGSPNISIHNRYSKKIGIEFGLQWSETDLLLHDKNFLNRNNLNGIAISDGTSIYSKKIVADSGCFGLAKYYYTFHTSGYYFLNSNSWINPYFGAGVTANILTSSKNLLTSSSYFPATNENQTINLRYSPFYSSLFLEAGFFLYHKKHSLGIKDQTKGPYVFISARYYIGGNMLNVDYSNTLNGNLQYADHVLVTGRYLGFSLRIGGRILKSKINSEVHVSPSVNRHSNKHYKSRTQVKNKMKHDTLKESNIPKKISNREIIVKKVINVKKSKITIKIWDHQNFDGDILSLNLNNEWILEDYLLKEKPKVITVNIDKGSNYLVLHAISEGKFSPCTAAIIIDDGNTKQEIIIDSNQTTSEAIKINFVE